MQEYLGELLHALFIALGVVVGGSMVGSLATLLVGDPTASAMVAMASRLKVWAVATALGGTFETFQSIDSGLFKGDFLVLARQLLFLFAAYTGAHLGYMLVAATCGGR